MSGGDVVGKVLTLSVALDLADVGASVWTTSVTSEFSVDVDSVVTIPSVSVVTASLLSGGDVVGTVVTL